MALWCIPILPAKFQRENAPERLTTAPEDKFHSSEPNALIAFVYLPLIRVNSQIRHMDDARTGNARSARFVHPSQHRPNPLLAPSGKRFNDVVIST